MRSLCAFLLASFCFSAAAQSNDIGWIAPEGKIINNRTLTWDDFPGKPIQEEDKYILAAVKPAIYFIADSGLIHDNGRVTFKFRVKCAFQSEAFVREATRLDKTNYVLIHEQDHYDIALNFANLLQAALSGRDYSKDKYDEEIDKIHEELYKKYRKTQVTYDADVNPEGRMEKEMQYLWDMRIKKCFENNTDAYYSSPESDVKSVKAFGQTVKRIPGEPVRQFVVRARPIYTEFTAENGMKTFETGEWTPEPSVLAFYTQKYYVYEDGGQTRDQFRTFAYLFVPNGTDSYKRIQVDTFCHDGKPVKIQAAFFANADSDPAKELVITYKSDSRDKNATGSLYSTKIYDNINPKLLPGKLKKLDDVALKVGGGFEGDMNGKPCKAKCKTEKEVADALRTLGYL